MNFKRKHIISENCMGISKFCFPPVEFSQSMSLNFLTWYFHFALRLRLDFAFSIHHYWTAVNFCYFYLIFQRTFRYWRMLLLVFFVFFVLTFNMPVWFRFSILLCFFFLFLYISIVSHLFLIETFTDKNRIGSLENIFCHIDQLCLFVLLTLFCQ